MNNLTKKQKVFFNNLKNIYQARALPSYEKIKDDFGYKSKNSIKQYFEILKKEKLISKIDDKYYINSSYLGAYLATNSIKAGFAGIMEDKIEKRISIDEILKINSPSTFVFKVSGDSMCDIGIFDNDYVIIQKQQKANIDDVVLAIIDNEFTLKTYKKDKLGFYLQAENKDYPILRPRISLSIFGKAIGIVRKF